MKRVRFLCGSALIAWAFSAGCVKGAEAKEKVTPRFPLQAEPFSLRDVRLLDGPFRHAMELDHAYLLSLDPGRLLYSFRLNAGLPTTARPYGGWMTPGRVSCAEFVGHFLSASAMMYASTGDEDLKARANRVVAGFKECQDALGTGYVHTKPDRFTSYAEAPLGLWYQIHKIMAGLLDMYVYCDNLEALHVARRLADWAKVGTDKLSDEQMQKMLEVEPGGINEALANLYCLTGEKKYLTLALRFNHKAVIGPASRREDNLTGLHANTQIPKFIGTAREYELTGDESLRTASEFFWQSVVHERSYVIGGNSIGEHFSPKETLSQALGPDTCETCNTYNMLKLTRHLFCWDPKEEYAEYFERALYNHILASQNPETGMMIYYLPLARGQKEYCTPDDSFWCCTGTGVENHSKYGDSIYFHQGTNALFVNLFIASELHWTNAGIVLRQETKFPDQERTKLVFTCAKPVALQLNIRHPAWAKNGFKISINGARPTVQSAEGSYAVIERAWKTGDTVDIDMPFSLRTEAFRDNPRRVALFDGPLVLCASVPRRPETPFPAMIVDNPAQPPNMRPVAGFPNFFFGSGKSLHSFDGSVSDVTLQPLYKMEGGSEYIVYWDVFTPKEWQGIEAKQQAINARTVDRVLPGNDSSERAHNVQGEKMGTDGKSYRHAMDGGWFSWDMRVRSGARQELRTRYWGSDSGNRQFDIFADGVKLASQTLDNNKPGEYFEVAYPLPEQMTRGKTKVRVRFQAHLGMTAGGVFNCAIVESPNVN